MEGHGRHTKIGAEFAVGVIGLGEGRGLVKGLAGHPELRVEAVCDTNRALAHEVAARYGVPCAHDDPEAFFAEPGLDFVAIYTPDRFHLPHIRMAFEAGLDAICTKPLVVGRDEAAALWALVRRHPDRRLMVGQSSRFFGPMIEQKAAVQAGRLGVLHFVEASYVHDMRWFYKNRPWALQEDFDLVFACCAHPIDLARNLAGDVGEVHALASRSGLGTDAGFMGEDTFVISLTFADGRIGRVLGLYGLEQPHQFRPWIEVAAYGARGTYVARYPQLEAVVKYAAEEERRLAWFEDSYHYFQFEGVNHHAGEFVNYTEAFARGLAAGETVLPDARDGLKTVATLAAVRASIASGRPEPVTDITAEVAA